MNLTDISTIKALCTQHGFSFSKEFGQNFIVNPGIVTKMVEGAGVDKDCGVIEIGPGIGVLTQGLAKAAKKVVAIEIDKRLPDLLKITLADCDNVTIIGGDALKTDFKQLIKEHFDGMRVVICANLPYYITSPILMKLLEEQLPIDSITVMVQKEAAERLSAMPGTREGSAITYAVRYYSSPQTLFTVQPGSFYPPPKVTSAVIRLALNETPPVSPQNPQAMFATVKAAFCQRRKTAANSISVGTGIEKQRVTDALQQLTLSPTIRPEMLTLQNFADLSDILY